MTTIEDKYTIEYNGSDDLGEFYEFVKRNTSMENEGYSDEEIQIIEKALPDGANLPKQYKIFLQNAGKKCDMWPGDDYLLIDDEGKFIDYSKDVIADEELYSLFLRYEIDLQKCLFFSTTYYEVFRFLLLGEDNPYVYIVNPYDSAYINKPFGRFSNMLIDHYNTFVPKKENKNE